VDQVNPKQKIDEKVLRAEHFLVLVLLGSVLFENHERRGWNRKRLGLPDL
jgi:hypothetical protein